MSDKHVFLTPEWIEAARAIREDFHGKVPQPPVPMVMNQVITDAPFGDGPIEGHVDTSSSSMIIEEGLSDGAEVTMTTDYETFRMIFLGTLDQDPAPAMQAFMSGKIKVDGDISKLMQLQAGQMSVTEDQKALATEIADRVKAITAD